MMHAIETMAPPRTQGLRASWRVGAAVLGSWVVVLPGSVTILALRMDEVGASNSDYAVSIAGGWLVFIAALVVLGAVGDRSVWRFGARWPLLLGGVAGSVLVVGLIAVAATPASLASCWLLMQIPAAAYVAACLGLAHDAVPMRSRGVVSGLAGAAPIAALLIGGIVTRTVASPSTAFLVNAALGAALGLPLLLQSLRRGTAVHPHVDEMARESAAPSPRLLSAAGVSLVIAWPIFLVSDFLLSLATSATNSFVIAFVRESTNTSPADTVGTAALLVIIASVGGILGAIGGGLLGRDVIAAGRVFAAGSLIAGIGLVGILLNPGGPMLWIGSALFGAGFGLANGSELAIGLGLRGGATIGRDLGVLAAVTCVPYVIVALAAALAVGPLGSTTTLAVLFSIGAFACLAASIVMFLVFRRARVRVVKSARA